jgi:hypothetical protein
LNPDNNHSSISATEQETRSFRPPPNKKQSLKLPPLFIISSALLVFVFLPPLYPLAGVFAAPLIVILAVSACILVSAPGFMLLGLAGERVPASLAPGLVVVGSAAGGWLLFWAWFADSFIGLCASLTLSATAMIALSLKPVFCSYNQIRVPVLALVIVCVGYLSVAGDRGGMQYGDQLIGVRYWANLDNQIPRMFADCLMKDRIGLKPFLLADWHSSDRPPLQTGMIMVGYPLVEKAGSHLAYLLLGVAVNMFWILGLWGFLRAVGIPEQKILQVVMLVALVGAVFINTVYTWPKMLSAALSLTVAAAILDQNCLKQIRMLVVGSASALSLLSHGSAAFALLGLAPLFWVRRKEWRTRDVIATLAVAALIYCPWVAYQNFYDPPGNRLIKWHLAGVIPLDEGCSSVNTIVEEYKKIGFGGFAVNKLHNFRMLLGDPTDWNGACAQGNAQPGWDSTFAGHLRHFFLLRLGPAPALLLIGMPLLFTRRVRQAVWLKPLGGVLITTSLVYLLLEFGSTPQTTTWLCHAPYTLLLLCCALGALAIGEMGNKGFIVFLTLHLALFVALWDYDVSMWSTLRPPPDPGKADLVAMLVSAFAVLTLVVLLLSLNRKAAQTDEPVVP